MKVITKIYELKKIVGKVIYKRNTIGFIPTMGALHKGHLSLMQKARKENDKVIVSIFVNPAQFNEQKDFERYPQTIEQDKSLIEPYVDYIFYPEVNDIYPSGFQTTIHIKDLSEKLEGVYRPGHFDGMTTIVCKLLHICRPTSAYFGLKDYQQYLIVCQMVKDLNIPVHIIGVPTVREQSGLAYSSRNLLLSSKQKESAATIYKTLQNIKKLILRGERDVKKIERWVKDKLEKIPNSKVEYVAVRSAQLHVLTEINQDIVISVAIYVETVRLIDNIYIPL